MIKTLGVLDLLCAAIFLIFIFFSPVNLAWLIWAAGLYLIIKGAIFAFSRDLASSFDIGSGAVILSSVFFPLPLILPIIVIVYLAQKGIFSLAP